MLLSNFLNEENNQHKPQLKFVNYPQTRYAPFRAF